MLFFKWNFANAGCLVTYQAAPNPKASPTIAPVHGRQIFIPPFLSAVIISGARIGFTGAVFTGAVVVVVASPSA